MMFLWEAQQLALCRRSAGLSKGSVRSNSSSSSSAYQRPGLAQSDEPAGGVKQYVPGRLAD